LHSIAPSIGFSSPAKFHVILSDDCSTVRYAQQVVFVDEDKARRTLDRINTRHAAVQYQRGQTIPDWAFRDVLYMLIGYSERAYGVLYGSLSQSQTSDLFKCFCA